MGPRSIRSTDAAGASLGATMFRSTYRIAPGLRCHIDGQTGQERAVTVESGRTVYRLNSNRLSRSRGIHVWCDVAGERELLPARELR